MGLPQVVHQVDRVDVDRGNVCRRIAELRAPVGACPPGRALKNEAHGVRARDVDIALVVSDQGLPALGIANQRKGREEGKILPILEDQAGLDSAVGQEQATIALGQPMAVLAVAFIASLRASLAHGLGYKIIIFQLVKSSN